MQCKLFVMLCLQALVTNCSNSIQEDIKADGGVECIATVLDSVSNKDNFGIRHEKIERAELVIISKKCSSFSSDIISVKLSRHIVQHSRFYRLVKNKIVAFLTCDHQRSYNRYSKCFCNVNKRSRFDNFLSLKCYCNMCNCESIEQIFPQGVLTLECKLNKTESVNIFIQRIEENPKRRKRDTGNSGSTSPQTRTDTVSTEISSSASQGTNINPISTQTHDLSTVSEVSFAARTDVVSIDTETVVKTTNVNHGSAAFQITTEETISNQSIKTTKAKTIQSSSNFPAPTDTNTIQTSTVALTNESTEFMSTGFPKNQTAETDAEKQNKKTNNTGAITAGVIVPILVILIIGFIAYKCYRRKYPVRMVIGKNFSKFSNPTYSKKSSTLTLERSVPFEDIEVEASGNGGHDNHALDYIHLQPAHMHIMTGDADFVKEIDEVPVKKPRRKKQISVMSRESVDGRVMSEFLQEALNEVDSEAETIETERKEKKKVSVDVNIRKNISSVSVESETGPLTNSDDDTDDHKLYENVPNTSHTKHKKPEERKPASEKSVSREQEELDESYMIMQSGDDEPNDKYVDPDAMKTDEKYDSDYDIVGGTESDDSNSLNESPKMIRMLREETKNPEDNPVVIQGLINNDESNIPQKDIPSKYSDDKDDIVETNEVLIDQCRDESQVIHQSDGNDKNMSDQESSGSDVTIESKSSSNHRDKHLSGSFRDDSSLEEDNTATFSQSANVNSSSINTGAEDHSKESEMKHGGKFSLDDKMERNSDTDYVSLSAYNENSMPLHHHDVEGDNHIEQHKNDTEKIVENTDEKRNNKLKIEEDNYLDNYLDEMQNDTGFLQVPNSLLVQSENTQISLGIDNPSTVSKDNDDELFDLIKNDSDSDNDKKSSKKDSSSESDEDELSNRTSPPPLPSTTPPDVKEFETSISTYSYSMPKDSHDKPKAFENDFLLISQENKIGQMVDEIGALPEVPSISEQQQSSSLTNLSPSSAISTFDSGESPEDRKQIQSELDYNQHKRDGLSESPPTPPVPWSLPPNIVQHTENETSLESFTLIQPESYITESDTPLVSENKEITHEDDFILVSQEPEGTLVTSTNDAFLPVHDNSLTIDKKSHEDKSDLGFEISSITNDSDLEQEEQTLSATTVDNKDVNHKMEEIGKVIPSPKIKFGESDFNDESETSNESSHEDSYA